VGAVKMKVTLLKYTPDPEGIVAMGARLCYSAAGIDELGEKLTGEECGRFIDMLLASGHHSPVEHASFTFGVEGVSRSLLAQITRHRIASFSVKSQRYVSEESVSQEDGVFGYVVPPRIASLGSAYVEEYAAQMKKIQEWYDRWVKLLGGGRDAYEDARFVLPNAAETKFLVTMNARELLHFFTLRCCRRAQWEIRALATEMLRQVKRVAPHVFARAGPACLRGPCPEGRWSCGESEAVRNFFADL